MLKRLSSLTGFLSSLGVSLLLVISLVWGSTPASAATDIGAAWGPDGITAAVCNVNAEGIGLPITSRLTLHMSCNLQGGTIVWPTTTASVWVRPYAPNWQWQSTATLGYGLATLNTGMTGYTCTQISYNSRWNIELDISGYSDQIAGNKVWAAPPTPNAADGNLTLTNGAGSRMTFLYYSNSSCTSYNQMVPQQPALSNSYAGAWVSYLGQSAADPAYPSSYFTGGSSGSGAQPCFTIVPSSAQGAPTTVVMSSACTVGVSGTAAYAWAVTGGSISNADLAGTSGSVTFDEAATYTVTLSVTFGGETYTASQIYSLAGASGADDIDCPTGWGLLNPASLGDLARCLFIPSGDVFDDMSDAYDGSVVQTVTQPMGNLIDWWGEFTSHATGDLPGNPGGADCEGPILHVPTGNVNAPDLIYTEIAPLKACDGDVGFPFRVMTHALTGFSFYFGFTWYAIRTVSGWLG